RLLAVDPSVVPLPRGRWGLSHGHLRPARDQADLLGAQGCRPALPAPARCAGPGVGGAGPPHGDARHLRRRSGDRHRARGQRDGAAPPPPGGDAVTAVPLIPGMALELGLAVVIVVVLVGGLALRGPDKRRIGVIAAIGLAILLGLAFRVEPGPVLFRATFVQDELAIFAKRLFLVATLLGV